MHYRKAPWLESATRTDSQQQQFLKGENAGNHIAAFLMCMKAWMDGIMESWNRAIMQCIHSFISFLHTFLSMNCWLFWWQKAQVQSHAIKACMHACTHALCSDMIRQGNREENNVVQASIPLLKMSPHFFYLIILFLSCALLIWSYQGFLYIDSFNMDFFKCTNSWMFFLPWSKEEENWVQSKILLGITFSFKMINVFCFLTHLAKMLSKFPHHHTNANKEQE